MLVPDLGDREDLIDRDDGVVIRESSLAEDPFVGMFEVVCFLADFFQLVPLPLLSASPLLVLGSCFIVEFFDRNYSARS